VLAPSNSSACVSERRREKERIKQREEVTTRERKWVSEEIRLPAMGLCKGPVKLHAKLQLSFN
jgi:hypothetical protein